MLARAASRWLVCFGAIAWTTITVADEVKTKADPPSAKLVKLSTYPARIDLTGPRDEQRIGVLGHFANGQVWELTRDAKFASGNAKIAAVATNGLVLPAGDGQTSVSVEVGGMTATIPVSAKKANLDILVGFTQEVQPILTRLGCNSGACHGSQHGKGGFRLSLFGFDPMFDYSQIVQSAEGRRVVLSDPASSILLQKPTLTMEHAGGHRMKLHGREYERIKQWLADGAPEPTLKDAHVIGLEVWPAKRLMVVGEQQQILVQATWSDGRREDVTATAKFDSLNDGVATVTPDGLVTTKGKGETHIMVRFMGQATVVQITLPYAQLESYPKLATHNFIDDKLIAKWKSLGLTPSELCSDEEFFRRVHLDTLGTLPAPEDIKKFLTDPDPQKRAKAIDKVLDRPEFVDFWALKWGDLLRVNRDFMQDRGMWSFHNWVRACVRDNKPIDEMVRDIITAEGSTFTEGPANFYMVARNPADWSESVTQTFLGVRVGCAKCHHHPFEKWSQDDYYGMSAFFVRLGTKNSQEFGLFGREQVVYLKMTGEQTHPRKGGLVKPHPLDGPDMDDPIDRRVKLADWMTSKDNAFFAKNMVNRFWSYFMGRGLVEPVDDLRATNPASNPDLLDALAKDFIDHKYDLKHLLKTLMNSRAYQLSAVVSPGNAADVVNVHFTRFTVRRLTAEQIADAIDFATGTREKYAGLPLGTKAIQLPDTRVKSFLLDVFGRPARQIVCECERTVQPNIAQAMHLLNGDFLDKKIAAVTGRVEKLLKAKKTMPEIVDELYLVTLSRLPRPQEMERAMFWIGRAPNQREGVQDLLWVLLNSREFVFNY